MLNKAKMILNNVRNIFSKRKVNSIVSSELLGKWNKDDLTNERLFNIIDLKTGLSIINLKLEINKKSWVTEGDSVVNKKEELSLQLVIDKKDSVHPIIINTYQMNEKSKADAEFEESKSNLIREYFFKNNIKDVAYNSNVSLNQQVKSESKLSKFFKYLGFIAIIFILYSFINAIFSAPKLPGNQVAQIGATKSTPAELEKLKTRKEMWNKLTPEQQKTLLAEVSKITNQNVTIDQILNSQDGQFNQTSQVNSSLFNASNLKLNEEKMNVLKTAYTLTNGSGSKTFYIFEDPLCSACQHFTAQKINLGSEYKMIAIPVAFQKGSLMRGAVALCSKDVNNEWATAMEGMPPSKDSAEKACDAGLKTLDSNNSIFFALGLTGTPTIVAPNGETNAGSSDIEMIKQWIDKNQN